jgi:hypothetical protein
MHAIALDQSALLELLEALKDTGVDDVVRGALEAVCLSCQLLREPARLISVSGGRSIK